MYRRRIICYSSAKRIFLPHKVFFMHYNESMTRFAFRISPWILLIILGSFLLCCGETSLREDTRKIFHEYLLFESECQEGSHLSINESTKGVKTYTGGPLPDTLDCRNKMYTFKTTFSMETAEAEKSWGLYVGLFEYPLRLYLNGTEILKRGRYKDGYYNSSLRLASYVYLSPDLLRWGEANEIVVEAYPAFETWALDTLYVDTLDNVTQAVFLRNFFGVNLLQGAFVLSLTIGIYFIVLYLTSRGDTRKYLYFAFFALLFCVVYFNVVVHHESFNEIFMESLSKSTMILLSTALLFFIKEFTKVFYRNSILWTLILLSGVIGATLVFIQPTKESLLSVFSSGLNFIIVPHILLSFAMVLIYGIRKRGPYFWPLFLAYIILLGTFFHDAYYFITMKLPYAWMMTYGFFALVVGIFVILISEQSRIYKTSLKQAEDLKIKQVEIEQLNRELTLQKDSFFRFVPTQFLELLGRDSAVEIQLGDSSLRRLSVLFSDIRRFTSLSEEMLPDKNFEFLNNYLLRMESAIYKNNGFIDKYIGDAIMALFADKDETRKDLEGETEELLSRSADVSLTAALEMEEALTTFNSFLQGRGLIPIDIGVGINTGPAMLGTVGSSKRLDTTVIGDSVNIASRLESLTKMYKTRILVSEHTYKALTEKGKYHLRHIDNVILHGKTKTIKLYELLNLNHEDAKRRFESCEELSRGMELYQNRRFQEAQKTFQGIEKNNPADMVAQLYLMRCQNFLKTPPSDDWKGIFKPHK